MFDEILIPTDGSGEVKKAVEVAIDIAGKYNATVHALYVVETQQPMADFEGAPGGLTDPTEHIRREGDRATREIAEMARDAGLEEVTSVREGAPRRDILDYADANGIDLIVMGTRGRTGLERFLLGSVTEAVVRHSPVPVTTVRRAAP